LRRRKPISSCFKDPKPFSSVLKPSFSAGTSLGLGYDLCASLFGQNRRTPSFTELFSPTRINSLPCSPALIQPPFCIGNVRLFSPLRVSFSRSLPSSSFDTWICIALTPILIRPSAMYFPPFFLRHRTKSGTSFTFNLLESGVFYPHQRLPRSSGLISQIDFSFVGPLPSLLVREDQVFLAVNCLRDPSPPPQRLSDSQ